MKFLNTSFSITVSGNSLIFNKDVVKQMGEEQINFLQVTHLASGSVSFEISNKINGNVVEVQHNPKAEKARINSASLVKFIKKILKVSKKTNTFKLIPTFPNDPNFLKIQADNRIRESENLIFIIDQEDVYIEKNTV